MSRYSVKDKAWTLRIMARDNYVCAINGTPATDAHHIFSKQAWPTLRWDGDNGIALSRARHRWAHDHPEAFKAWLQVARPEQWARLQESKREAGRHYCRREMT